MSITRYTLTSGELIHCLDHIAFASELSYKYSCHFTDLCSKLAQHFTNGPRCEKTCLWGLRTTKSVQSDQLLCYLLIVKYPI